MTARRGGPWWRWSGWYIAMALLMLAFHGASWWFQRGRPAERSPLDVEQDVLRQLDERLNAAAVTTVVVQEPVLGTVVVLALVAAFVAWIAGWVLLARWWAEHRRQKHRPRARAPLVWVFGDVGRIVIAALFAAHLVPLIQLAAYGVVGRRAEDLHVWILISMVVTDGTALLMAVLLARHKRLRWKMALGWRPQEARRRLAQGLTGYLATLPVFSLAVLAVMAVTSWLRYTPPPEPIVGLFLNESRWPLMLAATLLICLAGPLIEEVFFRGVLYPALRRRWGVRWGLVVSSGCFAALHTNLVGLLPIWLLGGVLAYLYETTGSLLPSIALHVVHNSVMMTVMWLTRSLLITMGR